MRDSSHTDVESINFIISQDIFKFTYKYLYTTKTWIVTSQFIIKLQFLRNAHTDCDLVKQKVLCYRLSSRFSVESSIKRLRSVCISPRNVTTGQSVLTFHRSCCHLTYDPWPYVALASDWSDRLCVDLCGQLGRPPGKEEGEEEWKEREWRGDWHWQTVDASNFSFQQHK